MGKIGISRSKALVAAAVVFALCVVAAAVPEQEPRPSMSIEQFAHAEAALRFAGY